MASPTNTSGLLQVDNLNSTSHNFTLSFTPTAGRDLVFTASIFNSAGGTISALTMGGTAATLLEEGTDGQGRQQIWLAQNVTGGTTTVALTFSNGTGNYVSGGIEEWGSGVFQNPALDTGTDNTTSGSSATPSASTAASTSQASTVIYAVLGVRTAASNNNITGPTSWTTSWTEQDSNTHQGGRGAWIEETTTGTKTATFGMTSGSWGVSIVAFKLVTGPTITAQPTDQMVNNGATASFSVTASGGTAPLTYQWQDNSSGSFANISGATSSTYAPTASYAAQGRQYRCVVTDAAAQTATSTAATLRVEFNTSGTGPRTYPVIGFGPIISGPVEASIRGTASASGASGTISVTLASATSSISGTTTVTGTISRTLVNDTSAITGTTTVVGTLARTLANDTSAIQGSPVIVGTINRTLASDTMAASGSVGSSVTGTINVTTTNDTSSISDTTTVVGTSSVTLSNATSNISGTTTVTGTLTRTLSNDTSNISGSVGSSVTGTISVTLSNDTLAASGTTTITGVIIRTLVNDTSVITGSPVINGSISRTLQNDTMTATGTSGEVVVGAGTKLPMTGVGV